MPPTLPHIEDNPMAVFLTEVGNNSAVYTNMIAIEPELPNFPTSAKGTYKLGSTISQWKSCTCKKAASEPVTTAASKQAQPARSCNKHAKSVHNQFRKIYKDTWHPPKTKRLPRRSMSNTQRMQAGISARPTRVQLRQRSSLVGQKIMNLMLMMLSRLTSTRKLQM